jgi:hypothetical protein
LFSLELIKYFLNTKLYKVHIAIANTISIYRIYIAIVNIIINYKIHKIYIAIVIINPKTRKILILNIVIII